MQIESLKCTNVQHSDEPATYFCKQEDCLQTNPLCAICVYQNHKNHLVQPIKLILRKINKDSESIQENLVLLAKIDTAKEQLYVLCANIPDQNNKKIIRQLLDHYLQITLEDVGVKGIDKFRIAAPRGKQQATPKERQDELIKKIAKYEQKYSEEQDQQNKDSSNYSNMLRKVASHLKQVYSALDQTIKKGEYDLSVIQSFSSGPRSFHFSPSLKHPKLDLEGKNIMKMSQQYVTYNYMALCNPPLSHHKPASITFNMVNLCSYITLGIAKRQKIPQNYQFNTHQVGHGSYQISYDGYSWCDTGSSNEQYTGWYFNQSDKITIKFDPVAKKVKFIKNGDENQNTSIDVEFAKNDKLHFCVTFNSKPEQVHIVD